MNAENKQSLNRIISARELQGLQKKNNLHFIITVLVMLVFLTIVASFSFQFIANNELDKAANMAQTSLGTIQSHQYNDLKFYKTLVFQLAKDSELQRYIMRPTDLSRSLIENSWITVEEKVSWINQIRFISNSGFEILRVDHDREEDFADSIENKQNKQDRDYFKKAQLLKENELYISPINLNREYNELSYPLTAVIRMAMKVYQPSGQPAGILVVNFYADQLISNIDEIAEPVLGSSLFLDEKGHYLQGYNKEQHWSHEINPVQPESFSRDHAAAWSQISQRKNGNLIINGDRFVFKLISLSDSTEQGNSYYIVQHISKEDIEHVYQEQKTRLLLFFVGLFIIAILIDRGYHKNRLIHEVEHLSLELISALFYSNEAVFLTDENWNIQIVNDAFCKNTGYCSAEFENMQCGQLCFIGNPALQAEVKKSIQEDGQWCGEVDCMHKEGHKLTNIIFASAIKNTQGEVSRYVIQLIDITELKKMEYDLKIAAAAFETRSAITITDKEGNILRVNQAFTEITGYEQHEVIGKNPRILSSGKHDKKFYDQLWGEIETNGFWQGEIWNKHKDGKIYPEWINITCIKNDNNEVIHYVATFEDITERKQLEEKIKTMS